MKFYLLYWYKIIKIIYFYESIDNSKKISIIIIDIFLFLNNWFIIKNLILIFILYEFWKNIKKY
jgi:hypothetical protein